MKRPPDPLLGLGLSRAHDARALGIVLLVSLFVAVPAAEAQTLELIQGFRTCPTAAESDIRLHPLGELGGDADPASIQHWARVVSLRPAGYTAGPTFAEGAMSRYGEDGTFQGFLTRSGGGPGELIGRNYLILSGRDSLVTVLDRAQTRLTQIRWDGTPVRTTLLSIPSNFNNAAYHPSGRLLVNRPVYNLPGAPIPLHLWDLDGTDLGPVGPPLERFRLDEEFLAWRTLAPSLSPPGFLSAPPHVYRVDLFDLNGALTRQWRIVSSWRSDEPWGRERAQLRPQPEAVEGLWQDEQGLIWLGSSVPTPGELEPVLEILARWGHTPPANWWNHRVHSVLEVFHPDEARVLACLQHPERLFYSPDGELVWTARETEEGDVRLRLFRVQLDTNHRTGRLELLRYTHE
ncbi:MAG: hypothetical protein WEA09_06545 [Gemmatimonadota bacterium]